MKNRRILMAVAAAALLGTVGAQAQTASKQEVIPPTTQQMGIMAAVVPVSDVDRAVAFYTKGMGFVAPGSGNPPGETMMYFPGGGTYVILTKPSGGAALPSRTIANRLIFTVPDIKALNARIAAAGYHVDETIHEIPQYHIVQSMIQDPDGNYMELVQRTP